MNKILCILPICINPSNNMSNKGTDRITQYINGLNKFFEYLHLLKEYNVDIYIFDNTLDKNKKLPPELLNIIPDYVKILNYNINYYGSKNKGAGLIETWKYLSNIIIKYDFLIHFEPRQLLLNFNFIEHFLNNKSNLFTYGTTDIPSFNTGLFCIECSTLINYINLVDLDLMIYNYISIEYDIYNYVIKNNIPYNIRDKMELIWFNTFLNCGIEM